MKHVYVGLVLLVWVGSVAGSEPQVSAAAKGKNGILVHVVDSEYQASSTKIRVLLPDNLATSKRYAVLYVLPVEPLDGVRWGDGLREVQKDGLHNKHGLICVTPTFSDVPWYADHPTDPKIRQEAYLLKVVLPFIDRTYPTLAKPEGRLLVGFSKSGWGAFALLLRHPDTFGKAAAWDAPLMAEHPDKWGMADIFGTQENFADYQLSALMKKQAEKLVGHARLIHFGFGTFRDHHQAAHRLMDEWKIAHQYRDGPQREHSWSSGWLPEAFEMLVAVEKDQH